MKLDDLPWTLEPDNRWWTVYVRGKLRTWRFWKANPAGGNAYPGGYAITLEGGRRDECRYELDPVSAQCLLLEILGKRGDLGGDRDPT